MYGLSCNDYRFATLPKSYLVVTEILPNLKAFKTNDKSYMLQIIAFKREEKYYSCKVSFFVVR